MSGVLLAVGTPADVDTSLAVVRRRVFFSKMRNNTISVNNSRSAGETYDNPCGRYLYLFNKAILCVYFTFVVRFRILKYEMKSMGMETEVKIPNIDRRS